MDLKNLLSNSLMDLKKQLLTNLPINFTKKNRQVLSSELPNLVKHDFISSKPKWVRQWT